MRKMCENNAEKVCENLVKSNAISLNVMLVKVKKKNKKPLVVCCCCFWGNQNKIKSRVKRECNYCVCIHTRIRVIMYDVVVSIYL